jgi:cytochrome c
MKTLARSPLVLVLLLICGCNEKVKKEAALMCGGDPDRGQTSIHYYGCSSCHTIPGIPGANGLVGPPLTQMASRGYIGGVLKNTPDNMIHWLENPPGIDPLTAMPNLKLDEQDARDIASYLYTLK